MVVASIVLFKHKKDDLIDTLNSLICTNSISKIILVDNDNSIWASNFIHDKVEYIKSPGNIGFGAGHNLAIKKHANNSDFFLICNPDIIFDVTEFEKLLEFAFGQNAGLFLPRIVYNNGENQYGARLLPSPLNLFARRFSPKYAESLDETYLLKNISLSKPSFVPYLHGCFMLFRSKCLLELKGFDERYFMYMEDVDLSRRCAERYGNIYYPLAQVIHLHEQGSYKNNTLLRAHLRSAWQYFNKWGWYFDSKRQLLNRRCLKQIGE